MYFIKDKIWVKLFSNTYVAMRRLLYEGKQQQLGNTKQAASNTGNIILNYNLNWKYKYNPVCVCWRYGI